MLKNVLILLLASAVAALLWLRRPVEPDAPAAAAAPSRPSVPPRFAPVLAAVGDFRARPELAAAAVGFCLIDPKGLMVVDMNAHTAFMPASSLKTLTTATALEVLGPEFHFTTEIRSTAPLKDGVIDGDLVIVGGGDPMLSSENLQAWAADLKARGLQKVEGKVRADTSLHHGSIYGDFWNWGDIGNGYGSGVAALDLDHNRFKIRFRPGAAEGDAAAFVSTVPAMPGLTWNNEVTTAAAGSGDNVVIHGGEGTSVIHLRGTVPLTNNLFQVTGAVPDPARHAVDHFQRALEAAGIQISGQQRAITGPTESLVRHPSPPLLEIVTSIHASSDNHETECVFRMLGIKAGKPPVEVIREHWKACGLEFTGLRMEDGCGLSRADFIRPADLARLQFLAARGPQGTAYKASLLSDGGLRWKGGAMSGIRTSTGYVTNKSGEEFCYALMVNHYANGTAVSEFTRKVMDAMLGL
ncbi:MAG: D-alanyl-D-alanine carboxypeptidase/D-alanyl-D-alanine endopeptidase [Prosthecobacter sp.]